MATVKAKKRMSSGTRIWRVKAYIEVGGLLSNTYDVEGKTTEQAAENARAVIKARGDNTRVITAIELIAVLD